MSTDSTAAVSRRAAIVGSCTAGAILATGCARGAADDEQRPVRLPAERIDLGGATAFPGLQIVVTQPRAGVYKAYSAVCTHQGCSVTEISGSVMKCPCHGSRFNLSDGSVATGPAREPLTELTVTLEGDTITVQRR
ncbi:Rieske (2Fe-2S) protein [Tsukamurella sp. DT100]|uniref:Rieske (2Fe-2S) protein n=1 Tax=Tsukamurella sp. DT100 TaxID=3393415 RepID=UPI003CF46B91